MALNSLLVACYLCSDAMYARFEGVWLNLKFSAFIICGSCLTSRAPLTHNNKIKVSMSIMCLLLHISENTLAAIPELSHMSAHFRVHGYARKFIEK